MNQVRDSIEFVTNTKAVISLPGQKAAVICFQDSQEGEDGWTIVDDDQVAELDQYVRFTVDPRLLFNILRGPRFGHWNNAEIGSHIQFYRHPEQFERGLYYCMNFFFGSPEPQSGAVPRPIGPAASKLHSIRLG